MAPIQIDDGTPHLTLEGHLPAAAAHHGATELHVGNTMPDHGIHREIGTSVSHEPGEPTLRLTRRELDAIHLCNQRAQKQLHAGDPLFCR